MGAQGLGGGEEVVRVVWKEDARVQGTGVLGFGLVLLRGLGGVEIEFAQLVEDFAVECCPELLVCLGGSEESVYPFAFFEPEFLDALFFGGFGELQLTFG